MRKRQPVDYVEKVKVSDISAEDVWSCYSRRNEQKYFERKHTLDGSNGHTLMYWILTAKLLHVKHS